MTSTPPSTFDYLRCFVDLKFGSDWVNSKQLFNKHDIPQPNVSETDYTDKTIIIFHNNNPKRFLYVTKYVFGKCENNGLPWFRTYLPIVKLGIFPQKEHACKFLYNGLFIQDFEHENNVLLLSDYIYRHIYKSNFLINFVDSILALLNLNFILICPATEIILVDTINHTLVMPSYNYCLNIFQPISEKLVRVSDPIFIHPYNLNIKHNETVKKRKVTNIIYSRQPLQNKRKSSLHLDKYSNQKLKEHILNMIYLLSLISVFWRLNYDHTSSLSRLVLSNLSKISYNRSKRNCFCSNLFKNVTINTDLELRSLIHDHVCVHIIYDLPKILRTVGEGEIDYMIVGVDESSTKYHGHLLDIYKKELVELKTFYVKLDFKLE
jgi:uncharacterized protein YebE (UPF0316 family)